MEKCKLCKINEPDKKNTHLIPRFLVKTILSEASGSDRDGVLFDLGTMGGVSAHFERDTSVEKITEILGRLETDEEIASRQDPLAPDFLFCTCCENKFSILEGYISQYIYDPLLANKQYDKLYDATGRLILIPKGGSANMYALFVYLIFWRMSVADYGNFKLQPKIEEKLRTFLNTHLQFNLKQMIDSFEGSISLPFPIVSTFVSPSEEDNSMVGIIAVGSTRFPYFAVINNMTFQLFEKPRQVKASVQHLFGLSSMINKIDSCMFEASKIKIAYLTHDQGKSIENFVTQLFAKKKGLVLLKDFKNMCLHFLGITPTQDMNSRYIDHLLNEEIPPGIQYTSENKAAAAIKVLTEFGYRPAPTEGQS